MPWVLESLASGGYVFDTMPSGEKRVSRFRTKKEADSCARNDLSDKKLERFKSKSMKAIAIDDYDACMNQHLTANGRKGMERMLRAVRKRNKCKQQKSKPT